MENVAVNAKSSPTRGRRRQKTNDRRPLTAEEARRIPPAGKPSQLSRSLSSNNRANVDVPVFRTIEWNSEKCSIQRAQLYRKSQTVNSSPITTYKATHVPPKDFQYDSATYPGRRCRSAPASRHRNPITWQNS
ncbi:DgyrCDS11959 [Dimorphilus gyrociliatus]|uniref:DgyrCDS11959 n=1 Tax=Dimorphilus gyrociliatus TaxID=2664684 RepID=A0A7I8W7G8_9ANNE|nr:DgyrCDS11959 [Dimorphilus gyrociliatus]